MSDEKTIAAYDRSVEAYADFTKQEAPHPTLVSFVKRVRPGGLILDLGCGPAHDSAYMRDAGFRVDPVDASLEMVKRANATFDIGARQAVFDDIRGTGLYDGIWANFSLLHASTEAFPGHLRALHRALVSHGSFHIAMKLGDGTQRDRFGRRYTYYSESALASALVDAGFNPLETTLGEDLGLAGDIEPWIAVLCGT